MSILRIVYMFWDGPESKIASLCNERMRMLNPSWSFVEADLKTCEEICGQRYLLVML